MQYELLEGEKQIQIWKQSGYGTVIIKRTMIIDRMIIRIPKIRIILMTSNLKNEKYEQSLKSNVYECNGQNYKIENSRSKIQEKESESD